MDEEDTAGYREPCAQCAAVDWGISDEGRFYCRSCHNVIERTREVLDTTFIQGSNRITTISRGSRTRRPEGGIVWMLCEGFQFILKNQADALLRLGVSPHFKDDVLCQLWRLYLQKTQQAYTSNPVTSLKFTAQGWDSDSDSAPGSSVMSASATDRESNPPSSAGSNTESGSEWSSSTNDLRRLTSRRRRSQSRMTMVKTLALIHLALVWSREALTLSDLLRLVKEGHIPYVNAYEELPEEMKLFGKDALLFSVLSIPSHNTLHREAQALVQFLQLPAFPPISRQTLLHPALLSLRFLTDANLPDELHRWVCRLMDRAGMADPRGFTINPQSHGILPRYEVQTAALIIVTMKLIFGLDDHTEWELSNQVSSQDDSDDQFNLRRWYRLMQAALIRAQKKADQDVARKQWRTKKPIFLSKGEKNLIMKRKRNAEQVQMCFEKLSSCPAGVQDISPSSFRFCWGDKDGSDGPSLHHMKVDRVLTQKLGTLTPQNSLYWHPALKSCSTLRKCRSHYSEVEATLPRSFVWLLQLFSFILDVKPYYLYEEVLEVERKVFGAKHAMYPKGKKKKRRTETRTRTSSRVVKKSGGKS